jgi:hypothetical protein
MQSPLVSVRASRREITYRDRESRRSMRSRLKNDCDCLHLFFRKCLRDKNLVT